MNLFPPGSFARFAGVLQAPVCGGRVRWAGTETAAVWTGYMDGAVEAGERAAEEAVGQLAGAAPAAGAKPGPAGGFSLTDGWVNTSGGGAPSELGRRAHLAGSAARSPLAALLVLALAWAGSLLLPVN